MASYDDFYEQFILELSRRRNEFPQNFIIPTHQKGKAYLGYNTGKSNLRYYTEYTSRGYGQGHEGFIVGLYMDGKFYEERLQLLYIHQTNIELEIGPSLVWLDTGRAGRIFFRLGEDFQNKTNWSEIIAWEIDMLQKVVKVFKPYLREL